MFRNFTLFLVLIFSASHLAGQKMVYDSLVIDFGKNNLSINAFVDTVRDLRNLPHNCVSINEKTKYVFIPVDNLFVIKKSLANEIRLMFLQKPDSIAGKKYRLEINEFVIDSRKSLFRATYTCNAAISVYSLDSTMKPHFTGTLLYENNISLSPKKKHPALGYEKIITDWKMHFFGDFQVINSCYGKDQICSLSNFRQELNATKKNMLTNIETCLGTDSWLADGEIIFSRPEAQKSFFREAYSLRYRNEKKYEAFETSIINKQNCLRVSDAFLFILKSKFFLGFNRWKGDEYKNHGLEDVLNLDLSISQNMVWNRFYKNGVTIGLGVMENLTYIYSESYKFKLYAVVQLGIKI
jgi:hypothetical protein